MIECGGRDCSSRSRRSRRCRTRPMRMMASRPSRGRLPCAARPRVSTLDPREPLVSDRHLQIGRLGDDGAISRPVPDEGVSADAGVFFVDDRGDDQPASRQAAFRNHPRRVNHGGHAALHVLGSASVEPARSHLGRERRVHALDADGVHVAAEHERPSGSTPFEHADDIGTPRRDLLDLHVESDASACAPQSPTRSALRPPHRARETD